MERRLRIALWVFGLAGALALSAGSLFLGDLNQDEGWYLYGARLVAAGQKPYIDFASTQGPVMSYVYGLADPLVRHWGLAGGRLFTGLLGLAGALLAARVASRVLRTVGSNTATRDAAAAGLVAFLLIGLNVFQSYYGTIVKTYSLTALWLLLGFLALTRAYGRAGAAPAALAGVSFLLAAATRISAAAAMLAVSVALLVARDVPRGVAWRRVLAFAAGAGAAALVVYLPFIMRAPAALWFALVEYHAGREAGGLLIAMAYKAGFVARVCLAYSVAIGIALVLAAHGWLTAAPAGGRGGNWLTASLWGSTVGVTLLHFAAPFPYDDYQAMIYPVFATIVAVALVRRCPGAWTPVAVFALCAMTAGASPLVQAWFIGPRDRIWWPLKQQAPLKVLQETAARLRALPGVRPGDELLTQDPYLAVEAGLKLPAGLELGQFSYFPAWSEAKARSCHVLNAAMFREVLRTSPAPVAAFSGYGFAIRSPEVQPVPEAEQHELWSLVEARYAPLSEVRPFGQADTTLRILQRRPAP